MICIVNIDDDEKWQSILRLSFSDCSVISAYTGRSGIVSVETEYPDVVLLSSRLPDMRSSDVLNSLVSLPQPPPVIVLGSPVSPHEIVSAIKGGAFDYLSKPYELKILREAVFKAARLSPSMLPAADSAKYPELSMIVGISRKMEVFKNRLVQYALTDASVLIRGETGTGKDLAAKVIHRISRRSRGPYLVLHAGGIPFTLMESQLYGTERGAFTDAVSKAGYFELSDNGTLFLDEIGEMTPSAQVKLLRILEDNEIYRIGGSRPVPIDVRIICATNKDIKNSVRRNRFRMDLFFRISTLSLFIPPLKERSEDIPVLVKFFMGKLNGEFAISNSALEKLVEYSWPGNVRELKNVIYRAGILSKNRNIDVDAIVFDTI